MASIFCWMEKRRRKKNWLGTFWKYWVFVPSTPGSELKKRMQCKEEESRAGGRERWPIKIIEIAGKTLEPTLVNSDQFKWKVCSNKKCLPNSNDGKKINCRRNCISYKITCLICLKDGKSGDMSTCYYGESEKICSVVQRSIYLSLIARKNISDQNQLFISIF